ncbi:acrosin-like [Penaeus monodon]|uniref:acrosin-like n=1 Tax=Penaeus monodon TaxID=6687 RepID=UPI0018A793BF|nr:acrosin-like [Penaeus monodon]
MIQFTENNPPHTRTSNAKNEGVLDILGNDFSASTQAQTTASPPPPRPRPPRPPPPRPPPPRPPPPRLPPPRPPPPRPPPPRPPPPRPPPPRPPPPPPRNHLNFRSYSSMRIFVPLGGACKWKFKADAHSPEVSQPPLITLISEITSSLKPWSSV